MKIPAPLLMGKVHQYLYLDCSNWLQIVPRASLQSYVLHGSIRIIYQYEIVELQQSYLNALTHINLPIFGLLIFYIQG